MSKKSFLAVGTVVDYFNVATDEQVKLQVVKSEVYTCDNCYFLGPNRHCPNQWDCGKEAREDKNSIIFKEV